MTPDQILEGAIEVLDRDGWHQGNLYATRREDGTSRPYGERLETAPVCAMGALQRASSGLANVVGHAANFYEAVDRLRKAVNVAMIPHWNDDPNTSKEDVILGLKRALHDGD